MVTTSHYPDGLISIGGEATVRFVNGAPDQVDSDIEVLWDFDNDGDFSDPLEDITGFLLAAESFTGRDFPSQVNGHAAAGTLQLTLDNTDDRFSTLNQASPVNGGAMALRTGRRVQVRTAGTADPQPTLLARDRFLGGDGALNIDELGNAWTAGLYGLKRSDHEAIANVSVDPAEYHASLVDVGVADYVVQARLSTVGAETGGISGNTLGVIYRWQDASNFSRFELDVDDGQIRLVNRVAGVDSTASSNGIEARDDFLLSVWCSGSSVAAYVDGVATLSVTGAPQTDETQVGLWATWGSSRQPTPGFNLFEVWSGLLQPTSGVLWTGEVEKVTTSVGRDRQKLATVRCRGRLAKLVGLPVEAARFNAGQGTGYMVGRVLNLAGQLSPLAGTSAIDAGTAELGLITSDDPVVDALDAARGFELAERGFLYERPEGALAFNSLAARTFDTRSTTPQAWFSDAPGAQLGFEEVEPLDAIRDVVNRVRVGVASDIPTVSLTQVAGQSASGVQNNVARTFSSTPNAGDLHVFVIASTVGSSGQAWRSPPGYTEHRNLPDPDAIGRLRIYSRVMDGTEASVTFYNDTGPSGGNWRMLELIWSADEWFGVAEGLYVSDVAEGSDAGPVFAPWDGAGTDFVTIRAGMTSVSGATVNSPVGAIAPLGYTILSNNFDNGSVNGFDLATQSAYRRDVFGFQDPGSWDGTFSGFEFVEAVTIAVRGFNGDPPQRGTRVIEFDDVASQDDHNEVMTLEATAAPFADVDAAEEYATDVLATYRNERPIISLTFTATRNAVCRAAAAGLRVNDRVHVKADGESGLGFAGDFFVEAIRHYWSDAGKRWLCTLELSPA